MMLGARAAHSSAVSSSWPVLAGSATTWQAADSATKAFDLPAGYQAGDLLVMILGFTGNYTATTPSGWTSVLRGYNGGGWHVFYKIATGSEGSTVSVTTADARHGAIILRFTGANIVSGSGGSSYNKNPDMVAHTPAISGKKYFYFCVLNGPANLPSMGTPPSNYTAGSVAYHPSADGNHSSIRYCYRNFLESAENPGVWTFNYSYPAYGTFAVYNTA